MLTGDGAGLNTIVAALIALVGSIVGWLLRDLSRRIDQLPERVVQSIRPWSAEVRSAAMAEVNRRFDEIDDRIERLTRAQEMAARVELLRLMGAPETPARVKAQIEPMLRDLGDGG